MSGFSVTCLKLNKPLSVRKAIFENLFWFQLKKTKNKDTFQAKLSTIHRIIILNCCYNQAFLTAITRKVVGG